MVWLEDAYQGLLQFGPLRTQPATSQVGQDLGIVLTTEHALAHSTR
ncbi:MAG TPA: hypothetical protein VKB35_05620 [Ktedonobacteraceae bacterium]|nr:hypothetical protein [Ktedonobacteraceae bacterium]